MAANFSNLSSPEKIDAAVDAIIAEATDLCTLEQIAALNTAHLSDSSLPTDLESRFRKLKSFPGATNPHPKTPLQSTDQEKENTLISLNRSESGPPTPSNVPNPDLPPKPEALPPTPSDGTNKPKISEPKVRKSPSPPRLACCFGFSPKRVERRKSNRTELDEILAEFDTFSLKDERRKLKKAWKEQEKVSRETDKMVEWVKQVSARMNTDAIDDFLDEELK